MAGAERWGPCHAWMKLLGTQTAVGLGLRLAYCETSEVIVPVEVNVAVNAHGLVHDQA
jgi:hypothetical protein